MSLATLGTAVLLGAAKDNSPEWDAMRAGRLGGSEIAAVIGLSKWESRFSLWHRKRGLLEEKQANANMTVGHIMLKVLAGFVVALGVFGVIPLVVVFGVTLLEIGIAALQAYVFTILTCIYLNDAINMH